MNRVALSVVVPVYNVQDYIEECLESIVNQVEPFDEIILVNDGSTDSSPKICEEFCQKYTNWKLINQENQGLSCARNAGIKYATGDYILFVDSDDYIRSDMALTIKKEIINTNLDVLFYSASMQYDISQKKGSSFYIRKCELCNRVMSGQQFLRESFQHNYIVSACLAAYKREFLMMENIVFPKDIYFEDNVFSLNIFLNAKQILCISEQLYIRRIRNGSITTSKLSVKKCEDIIKVQLLQWEMLCKNEIVIRDISFFKKFISFGIVQVIDKISEIQTDNAVLDCERTFITNFFQYWYSIYADNNGDLCETGILLFMLKECQKYPECIDQIFSDKENYQNIYQKTETLFHEYLKKMLGVLPFNRPDKKIAVYGIGNHTDKLFYFYQKIFDIINCDLYFVVTKGASNSTYFGEKVVSCDAIDENTDFIVISSLVYQDEMLNQLKKRKVRQEQIITLYNNSEIYDLVLAGKIEDIGS